MKPETWKEGNRMKHLLNYIIKGKQTKTVMNSWNINAMKGFF